MDLGEEYIEKRTVLAFPEDLRPRCGMRLWYYSHISSETLQSSKLPSGRYLRMISGIFFCASSLIAICKGSVSPSAGTSIGAFMLMVHLSFVIGFNGNRQNTVSVGQSSAVENSETHLICSALVPRTLARSYFVKYGVVTRTLFGLRTSPPCPPIVDLLPSLAVPLALTRPFIPRGCPPPSAAFTS